MGIVCEERAGGASPERLRGSWPPGLWCLHPCPPRKFAAGRVGWGNHDLSEALHCPGDEEASVSESPWSAAASVPAVSRPPGRISDLRQARGWLGLGILAWIASVSVVEALPWLGLVSHVLLLVLGAIGTWIATRARPGERHSAWLRRLPRLLVLLLAGQLVLDLFGRPPAWGWLPLAGQSLWVASLGGYAAAHAVPGTRWRRWFLGWSLVAVGSALVGVASIGLEQGMLVLEQLPEPLETFVTYWIIGTLVIPTPLSAIQQRLSQAPQGLGPTLWEALEGVVLEETASDTHHRRLEGEHRGHPLVVDVLDDPVPGLTQLGVRVVGLQTAVHRALRVLPGEGAGVDLSDALLDHTAVVHCADARWAQALLQGSAEVLLPLLHRGGRIEGDVLVLELPGLAPSASAPWSGGLPEAFELHTDAWLLLDDLAALAGWLQERAAALEADAVGPRA